MPKKTEDGYLTKEDIETWVKTQHNANQLKCMTCKHIAANTKTISILKTMAKSGAHHISARTIHNKVKEDHPDYGAGYHAFQDHLQRCLKDKWDRAKGRTTS